MTMGRRASALVLVLCLGTLLNAQDVAARDFQEYPIRRDDRLLQLQISTSFGSDRQIELMQWIEQLADSLAQVYGHWPLRHWAVSISPADAGGSDPIPWARIHRGEVDRVEFFVLPGASKHELAKAWTGYHEMAHLLIPYRGWGDAWFSEGLASYYQNILQARSGILSEQQMWQKLHDGFMRGRNETRLAGQHLREATKSFRRERAYMRVYWSGAWYFMAADIRLRQQSAGKLGLDQALAKLNECCADQSMSVPAMAQKLDELNRVLLFEPLYEELRESTQIPDHEAIFASLGIDIEAGQVSLQARGPGAAIRQQIYRGTPL